MTTVVPLRGSLPAESSVVDLRAVGFHARVSAAIDMTREYAVVYEDSLGEGDGAWHSGARYPTDRVNCMTWLLLVLAEAYSANGSQATKRQAMDCLRYYGGHVGFSMRKHYLEQWLAFDPGPLRVISLARFYRSRLHASHIEPATFLSRRAFDAPLYHAEKTSFEIEYAEAWTAREAAQRLPDGFYVVFAVPTAACLERFGESSGPFGLVHCLFLELDRLGLDRLRPLSSCTIHHASIKSGTVESVPLDDYLLDSVSIHRGYVVCALDPEWAPLRRPLTEEARRLVLRERQFEPSGFRPYRGF